LLQEEADLAIVVGGYNSSNTTHLVELLEEKFTTYFIQSEASISDATSISSYNIHSKKIENLNSFLPEGKTTKTIVITSGASCPDSIVDGVIQKVLKLSGVSLGD
jgi:4-hydroxy-3-methylbut-2-enyl diphosphate reductase